MTPLVPLADPLPQPAPPALVWALLQLTFLLHVLAMNLVLGGSLLALLGRFSRRAEDAALRARLLAAFDKALPVALAATVTLGVAPLLFVQVLYGRVFFTSSILMGWYWLGLVPLVIAGYYGAYLLAFRGDGPGRAAAWVRPGSPSRSRRPPSCRSRTRRAPAARHLRRDLRRRAARPHLNLGDPSFWPRYLHVLFGALAVASLAVARVGAARRRADPEFARWAVRRGTRCSRRDRRERVRRHAVADRAAEPVLTGSSAATRSMGLLAGGIVLAVVRRRRVRARRQCPQHVAGTTGR